MKKWIDRIPTIIKITYVIYYRKKRAIMIHLDKKDML